MPIRTLFSGGRDVPAKFAALSAASLGLLAVVGWVLDLHVLTSLIPGAAEMKLNTALCFVLSGCALYLSIGVGVRDPNRVAQVMAAVVLAVGVLTLCQYAFGWDLHIDQALVTDRQGNYNAIRGRMSPYTTLGFIALGTSLSSMQHARLAAMTRFGASVATLVGIVSLLGYLWNATDLITDALVPPVAINTATAFILLGAGVWLAPVRWHSAEHARLDFTTVELRILVGFVAALGLVLAAGSYTYRSNEQFANSLVWVAHTQEVRADLADLTSALAGADLALRDHLVTRDADRREEYQRLIAAARADLNSVAALTADNAEQHRLLQSLTPQVDARVAALASVLRAFDDYGLEAARAVINVTRRSSDVPSIRLTAQRMDAIEARLLAERERTAKSGRRVTLLSLLITLSLAAILFAALFRGVHREMRARRTAESALRASDRYNRTILDSSPDGLFVISPAGALVSMTPQAARMLGIDDVTAIAGRDWCALWSEPAAARATLESARSGTAGRFRGYCKTFDGLEKCLDVIVEPIAEDGEEPQRLLVAARDISDVVHAEHELRQAHELLDSVLEHLPVLIIVKDAVSRKVVRLNQAAARFVGVPPEQAIGQDLERFLDPAAARAARARDEELLKQRRQISFPQETFLGPDGARTFTATRLPIFDEKGNPRFIVTMSIDVTEQKLREQAISELNLALTAKAHEHEATIEELATTNNELESFSYSVSHDLRAPLRAIDGFSLMLDEDYADKLQDEGRRYLKVIRDNSKRMGALIDDLLAFSRLGRLPVAWHEVNVESLVREVVDEQLETCEGHVPQIDIAALPPALGDRNLLRQVWTNLISNAIKYSSKSSTPRVAVEGHVQAAEIRYSVRDNGVGFDMEYYDKLFGVFQRLHRQDEFTGTGVGLAIVQRVVARHGGRVWAEGKINGGATFSFALPKESAHSSKEIAHG